MLYLLILAMFLFMLAILSYYTSKRDIMSPTFILSVLFLASNLFAIVGNVKWKVTINPDLLFVFFVGMLALYLGELIVLAFAKGKKVLKRNFHNQEDRIDISFNKMMSIIIINSIILVLYFRRLVQMASSIGYSGSMLLKYVRVATITEGIKAGAAFTIFLGLISASGYFCIYIIIHNILIAKTKPFSSRNLIYYVPIIQQIIRSIIGGARNGLISIVVVVFACSIIQYQGDIKKVKMSKILVFGSIALCGFLILFTNLGKLTGKTTVDNFTDTIFIYAGSSIVAFSAWLDKGLIGTSNVFGGESFWGIRYLMNMIFPSIHVDSKFLEMTWFADGTKTNIYTAFRSYLFDFGWSGLLLIMFLIGFIFNISYKITKKHHNPFLTVLYAYFLYNYIYILFTPSITSNLFTSSQIFSVFWMLIIYKYMFRPKKKIKV